MHAYDKDDIHWQALAGILRQVLSRGPLTLAEAEATFDATQAEPLAPEAVDALIARATVVRRAGRSAGAKRNRLSDPATSRRLNHESLERRDLLTPLLGWFDGSANYDSPPNLPAAPAYATGCYAAAW